ncbi:MAG: glycine--tRNA ligase subunit beta [Candidatus Coatesbacteria bacterium]|nr:glycine--tRNA ligase subunit beta [Candidatus Coatesbacteria bacterium]
MGERQLLFEIGVEDLPPSFVKYGREHIERTVPELLTKYRIGFDGLEVYGTPRRLSFELASCVDKQADSEEVCTGPALRVAYDQAGNPTKAAMGFARSAGVPVEELYSVETSKGEYVAAKKAFKGKPSVEVLPEVFTDLVESFSFPKMMRWSEEKYSFGRPIRWILAIFGHELIDCTIFGVRSNQVTHGTWTQGDKGISIAEASSYFSDMAQNYIAVSHDCRTKAIEAGIKQLEEKLGCEVIHDQEMLSILADSVDSPMVTHGGFDPRFLELPEPVLTTCLWHHQYFLATRPKFFSKPSGGFKADEYSQKLLPHFVALLANPEADEEIVRGGNEAVLEARLEDAAFFYAEDQKSSLEEILPRLQGMALHKGLGDLLMKSRRLSKLAPEIADLFFSGEAEVGGCPIDEFKGHCGRAGLLCKADLVTHMVGEFPELQGVMGGAYSKLSGDAGEIGDAISEHYRPRGIDDVPPKTDCGRVLALADKIDSLCAFFGAGHIPKGSQDPLGLRREAQGVVSILLDSGYGLPLLAAFDAAVVWLEKDGLIKPDEGLGQRILEFVKQRLSFNLVNRESMRHDLVGAVLACDCDDVVDLRARALALQEFSKDEQFESLTTGLKRASNILKGENWGELNPGLLNEDQEIRLFESIRGIEDEVRLAVEKREYLAALRLIAGLRPAIDDFFDHVMVMVDDEGIRQNRLALLARLTNMFSSIADFSKIVVERN